MSDEEAQRKIREDALDKLAKGLEIRRAAEKNFCYGIPTDFLSSHNLADMLKEKPVLSAAFAAHMDMTFLSRINDPRAGWWYEDMEHWRPADE